VHNRRFLVDQRALIPSSTLVLTPPVCHRCLQGSTTAIVDSWRSGAAPSRWGHRQCGFCGSNPPTASLLTWAGNDRHGVCVATSPFNVYLTAGRVLRELSAKIQDTRDVAPDFQPMSRAPTCCSCRLPKGLSGAQAALCYQYSTSAEAEGNVTPDANIAFAFLRPGRHWACAVTQRMVWLPNQTQYCGSVTQLDGQEKSLPLAQHRVFPQQGAAQEARRSQSHMSVNPISRDLLLVRYCPGRLNLVLRREKAEILNSRTENLHQSICKLNCLRP